MNKREFIENFIFYGIIAGILFLCGKYLLPIMIPFIIGFVVAYVAHEISKKFTEDMNKAKKLIVLVVIYLVLVVVIFFVIAYLVDRIAAFVTWISGYGASVEGIINNVSTAISKWSNSLPQEAKQFMETISGAALEGTKNILMIVVSGLSNFVTNIVTSVPSLFLSIVVAIISSFYILADYDRVMLSLKRWVPERLKGIASDLALFVKNKLFKIIKSYILIMGLTCLELVVGLFIIRTPNTILLGVLIAVLDILPVLGVGTALIPWAIVDIILGNTVHGILLLVIYIIITVVRNIVEPKLVGEDLGLDPLTTLVAMIVGMQLFGIVGLFGVPLGLSFWIYVRDMKKTTKTV